MELSCPCKPQGNLKHFWRNLRLRVTLKSCSSVLILLGLGMNLLSFLHRHLYKDWIYKKNYWILDSGSFIQCGEIRNDLTLVFYHVIPYVCNSFRGFFCRFGSKNKQAFVFLDHVTNSGPISTILGHTWYWEPELLQTSSSKHISQSVWRRDIVFDDNGDDFRRVCSKKCLELFQNLNGWLLGIQSFAWTCSRYHKQGEIMAYWGNIQNTEWQSTNWTLTKAVKSWHLPSNEWHNHISFRKSYVSSINPLTPFCKVKRFRSTEA